MAKNRCLLMIVVGGLAVLGLSLSVTPAGSQGLCPGPSPCSFRDFRSIAPTLPGRPARLSLITLCYNTFFGQPVGCGNVFTRILGLAEPPTDPANNGGHQHGVDTHPVTAPPPDDKLVFNGLQFDPTLGFGTGPVFGLVIVANVVPEVAGQLVYEWLVRVPLRFQCATNCFDAVHSRTLLTLDVGVRGLEELMATADDPFVFKPRPSTEIHPDAHQGTEALHTGIRIISKVYVKQTRGRKPRITDMSLPRGGLFDLCGTWNPQDTCAAALNGGHGSHRDGHDVDFSKEDSGGLSIDCFLRKDQEMQKTFDEAQVSFKKCYKDGHYHVRFP